MKGLIGPRRRSSVRAPLSLAAALLPLLSTAQPSGPLLLMIPSATGLNLTAGEVAPLAFALQNLGGEARAPGESRGARAGLAGGKRLEFRKV